MEKEGVLIASDHAGYEMKETLKPYLVERGLAVVDMGPDGEDSVDYPDYAAKVASAVSRREASRGILICGTGLGMSIVANRFPGVRAALCYHTSAARYSREHNDSNILVLGGRMLGKALACEIVGVWLDTPFAGGRHERRLVKIRELEAGLPKGTSHISRAGEVE